MEFLASIIGGIIVVVSLWYVPRRLNRLFEIKGRYRYIVYVLFIGVDGVYLLLYQLRNGFEAGSLFTFILLVVSTFIGTEIFLILFVYIYRVLELIGFRIRYAGIILVTLAFVVTMYGMVNAKKFEVREVIIEANELEDDILMVHLSDIHLGHFQSGTYLSKVVDTTNSYDPDIVILNGDLFDNNVDIQEEVLGVLEGLEGEVYFTQGNHETYNDYGQILDAVNSLGITVLNNKSIETHGIQLTGVDYFDVDEEGIGRNTDENREKLEAVVAQLPATEGMTSIFIEHTPDGLEYARFAGYDLAISGHTHGGGQVFPATLFAKLLFDYPIGLYQEDSLTIYVSQGVGTCVLPMRLGTTNEINVIRLSAAKQ